MYYIDNSCVCVIVFKKQNVMGRVVGWRIIAALIYGFCLIPDCIFVVLRQDGKEGFMIGIILKELRAEKGVTQVQLATKLGVKQSTISSWEIERTSPTLEQLGDLANIFEVTCDYLIGRTKETTTADALTGPYKRRLALQKADYSLADCVDAVRKYAQPFNVDKEKLVEFFGEMNDADFLEFANAVAAYIDSRD